MLVMLRGIGQKIRIGADITITIIDVKGAKVRIGVAAPDDIQVNREEVAEEIEKEGKDALSKRRDRKKTD